MSQIVNFHGKFLFGTKYSMEILQIIETTKHFSYASMIYFNNLIHLFLILIVQPWFTHLTWNLNQVFGLGPDFLFKMNTYLIVDYVITHFF